MSSDAITLIVSIFRQGRPGDVRLNQPGRALFRAFIWSCLALAFALPPLGLLCLQLARVRRLNYVLGNLGTLFVSGALSELLIVLVVALTVLTAPFGLLQAGRVPPQLGKDKESRA